LEHPVNNWISHPEDIEARVAEWQTAYAELLKVDSLRQFTGRPVFALTVTNRHIPAERKKKLLVFTPHAHEPACNAACMNVVSELLTGKTIGGEPTDLDRERILGETLLTFLPDANPEGTARAPVEAWDGSQYTNDEFWTWMRGVDPVTGKMWKRLNVWDDREEDPLPARHGIVYEQLDSHRYVEPNRHPESSLMRLIERCRGRHDYDMLLDLHQTEFVNSPHNCMVLLPCVFDELPESLRTHERAWADAVVAAWRQVEGASPIEHSEPLGYTGEQRQYFVDVWSGIYATTPLITIEIQNNSPRTPPELQLYLEQIAIETSIQLL